MSFDLRIRCKSIEDAERIIACLKISDPSIVGYAAQEPYAARPPSVDADIAAKVRNQKTSARDAVKAALVRVQKKYCPADMAKPLALLSQFSAARITEVKRADHAAFIDACDAMCPTA